jgi:hypothetical protein
MPQRVRDVPVEILGAMGLAEGTPLESQARQSVLGDAQWLAYSESWQPRVWRGGAPTRCLRSARFKSIEPAQGAELDDLRSNSAERRNPLDEAPETTRASDVWLKRGGGDVGDAGPVTDAVTEEQLRALGYLE